ncbi:MAG: helicase associated domain-containing protein, partial [Clostridia bacterium]
LGRWCARQRESYAKGELQDFQIESLKAINFDLRTNGEIRKANEFEKSYKEYIDFFNIHKRKPTSKTNKKLYTWYSKSIKRAELGSLNNDMLAKFKIIQEL